MSRNRFHPTAEALPATLPVFPLPGALVLPDTHLPLNVFEPRYLAMTLDALRTDRLIGMVQPKAETGADGAPALYDVGTAGRIVSFQETDDGRLLITLFGVARFRIAEELATVRGYRRVVADWTPFLADLEPPGPCSVERDSLLARLRRYFDLHGLKADWDTIDRTALPLLVNTLAVVCPFPVNEKQALVEAQTIDDRAQTMNALIDMALHAPDEGDKPAH
ncbi:MAG: LON peptidase substrate-binding domain-containing protein [Alphaproteobacteria bacterium]